MSKELSIEIDLWNDLVEIALQQISFYGYDLPKTSDGHKVLVMFYNLLKRRVMPIPRRIIKASNFFCPANRIQGLSQLENKIESGVDVNAHLSRKITDLVYKDGLLNDWGIQHFHLGIDPSPKNPTLIKGTSELLFARITEDTAYFLTVMDHHAFQEQKLIEIIHDNWPETVKNYHLSGVSLVHNLTENERKLAREHGIFAGVDLGNENVYSAIGGGYTTDGTSLSALRAADRAQDFIESLEKQIREDENKITRMLKEHYGNPPSLIFKLLLVANNRFQIVETGFGIPFFEFDNLF